MNEEEEEEEESCRIRQEEKCFIMHGDLSYLPAVIKRVSGVHPHNALIATSI